MCSRNVVLFLGLAFRESTVEGSFELMKSSNLQLRSSHTVRLLEPSRSTYLARLRSTEVSGVKGHYLIDEWILA
jgi:hypothetical protein